MTCNIFTRWWRTCPSKKKSSYQPFLAIYHFLLCIWSFASSFWSKWLVRFLSLEVSVPMWICSLFNVLFLRLIRVCTLAPGWKSTFLFAFRCLNSSSWTLLSPTKNTREQSGPASEDRNHSLAERHYFMVGFAFPFPLCFPSVSRNQPFLSNASCWRSYDHLLPVGLREAVASPSCHTLLSSPALR